MGETFNWSEILSKWMLGIQGLRRLRCRDVFRNGAYVGEIDYRK
jgi:hypothetical protein